MKENRIEKLTLENFKCHDHLTLDFGSRNASVYGDKASGKTSIYDALTWLLFGKDSQGGGTMEVKPLNADGEVRDHLAVTQVTAVLRVEGRQWELLGGGVGACCVEMPEGAPYGNLNTGARINLGIDIINTMSRHYGVRVPLFVDNAESVTQLEPGLGQVIRLVVSPRDSVLRLERE